MYRLPENQNRYAAQLKHSSPGCAFCSLKEEALHSDGRSITAETSTTLVVNNKFPYDIWEGRKVEEHLMVIPKRHVTSLKDLREAEQKEIIDVICRYGSSNYDVYTRSPSSIILSMTHLHIHLIKTGKDPVSELNYCADPYDLKVSF